MQAAASDRQPREWKPWHAAILSLILPGAGHIYKGQKLGGFLWLFFVFVGYVSFMVPGLILHLICIITAALGIPYKKTKKK